MPNLAVDLRKFSSRSRGRLPNFDQVAESLPGRVLVHSAGTVPKYHISLVLYVCVYTIRYCGLRNLSNKHPADHMDPAKL